MCPAPPSLHTHGSATGTSNHGGTLVTIGEAASTCHHYPEVVVYSELHSRCTWYAEEHLKKARCSRTERLQSCPVPRVHGHRLSRGVLPSWLAVSSGHETLLGHCRDEGHVGLWGSEEIRGGPRVPGELKGEPGVWREDLAPLPPSWKWVPSLGPWWSQHPCAPGGRHHPRLLSLLNPWNTK